MDNKKPLVTDTSDEAQNKRAKDRMTQRENQFADDLKWIFSDRRGRRFYWDLMAHCGVFKNSFTGNSTTFFNEGKRNVGLKLINDLTVVEPAAYLKMVQEEQSEQERESDD